MSTSIAYYNERDPFTVAWLVELIKEGVIADGVVDDRDIQDVAPDELKGYSQWHLFAGVGGWSTALRLAGWPDYRPVITVSCPCQPYSSAGKGAGFADERHLWPSAFHIIHGLRDKVPTVFGEQVSSAVNHGWWDLVADDLEGIGYEVWAKDFPACSVGAFHKRQRLYFVADATCKLGYGSRNTGEGWRIESTNGSINGNLAHAPDLRRIERRNTASTPLQGERTERSGEHAETGYAGELSGRLEGLCGTHGLAKSMRAERGPVMQHRDHGCNGTDGGRAEAYGQPGTRSEVRCSVDNSPSPRRNASFEEPESETRNEARMRGFEPRCEDGGMGDSTSGEQQRVWQSNEKCGREVPIGRSSPWSDVIWLPCRDGKLRPVEPGIFPLSHGLPRSVAQMQPELRRYAEMAGLSSASLARAKGNRIGALRGAGNAIVPQAATEFIAAYIESVSK